MIMSRTIKNKLNKYILMPEDHPDRTGLFHELRRIITSPKLVAELDFLPHEHILKRESIIVSDAFEALTNGMINDEILNQLSLITEESLFYPWKILIEGLHAFYRKDRISCLKIINTIPGDSAPYAFRELFSALLEGTQQKEWEPLIEAVLEDNSEIRDSLDLIRDASGLEDVLLDTAGLLIRDLIRDDPGTCEKIMIWCLDHLQLTDVLSDRAVERAKSLFGDKEGYRLAALASVSFDPDRSLVYWLHSLIAYMDGSVTEISCVKAYLNIIRDLADAVKLEFELTGEYIRLITDLVGEVGENLFHIYPEITGSTPADGNPFTTISRLAGEEPLLPVTRKVRDVPGPVVQLELFAF